MSTQNNEMILINDVMLNLDQFPVLSNNVILKESLEEMNNYKIGIVCIVDKNNKLIGVLTDGDIRRKLLKVQKPFSALLVDDAILYSERNPITIRPDDRLKDSVKIMGLKQIWDLPVTNESGVLVGLLHLHPAIKVLLNNK